MGTWRDLGRLDTLRSDFHEGLGSDQCSAVIADWRRCTRSAWPNRPGPQFCHQHRHLKEHIKRSTRAVLGVRVADPEALTASPLIHGAAYWEFRAGRMLSTGEVVAHALLIEPLSFGRLKLPEASQLVAIRWSPYDIPDVPVAELHAPIGELAVVEASLAHSWSEEDGPEPSAVRAALADSPVAPASAGLEPVLLHVSRESAS